MSDALKLVAILRCAQYVPAQTAFTEGGAKAIVLQKNEGELRTRRPREGVASLSSDFLLKVSPKTARSIFYLGRRRSRPAALSRTTDITRSRIRWNFAARCNNRLRSCIKKIYQE